MKLSNWLKVRIPQSLKPHKHYIRLWFQTNHWKNNFESGRRRPFTISVHCIFPHTFGRGTLSFYLITFIEDKKSEKRTSELHGCHGRTDIQLTDWHDYQRVMRVVRRDRCYCPALLVVYGKKLCLHTHGRSRKLVWCQRVHWAVYWRTAAKDRQLM